NHALYSNPELPPFPIIQYMPMHYYVVAGLAQLFRIDQDVHSVMMLNRFLCLLFDLILFIPVQRILWHTFLIKNRKICWAVCFGIFLILPNTNYGRIDNLYLLSFAFAIYYFLGFLSLFKNKYGAEIVFAAIFGSLAFFTKQSGIFLLAAMFLFLLFYLKDRKALLIFSSVTALTCLILFTILIGSNYENWFLNAYRGLENGINLGWFQEVFIEKFFRKMYFFIAGGLALALISCSRDKDIRERFLGFLALVVFIFALISSLKWGSSINYFTEFLMLTFMLSAVYFKQQTVLFPAVKLFFLFITPFFIMNVYNDKGWNYLRDLKSSKADYDNCSSVASYLKKNVKNDEFIFTAFHRENMMNLLSGEKALFPTREIVFYCAAPLKIFNYDRFTNMVNDGKVKYLVGRKDVQPDRFLNAEFKNYIKVMDQGPYTIYIYDEKNVSVQ
ncbi:MAG: hypothetical protein ABI772_12480, partial [Bacteroidota bacterium]